MLHRHLSDFRHGISVEILVLWLCLPLFSSAQYYNLGQDPASIRWRQIKTGNFRVIYPSSYEKQAQDLTSLLEYVREHGTTTLAHKPRRVPVIIHNRDIIPNAFSVWAPRRIELYTCPPQNSYAQYWNEQLAIHEYRHIVQMDMLNKGFTRGLSWLFGEQATAIVSGLFVPMWFMEGDAVCTETAISHSGRGRIPSFEMEIRSQMLQKGMFSYDKAVFGSYRDFIPDQYVLGYQIVANTRRRFGAQSWISGMDMVARQPFRIPPLDAGLKKATGMNKVRLYRLAMNDLDSLWREQNAKTETTPFRVITRTKSDTYRKYKYPHYLNDSLILAERTGLDDISRFVISDLKGNETVLCTPGIFSSDVYSVTVGMQSFGSGMNKPGSYTVDNLSISKGLLAWTERESDIRWQNRNYSVIKLYDFKKKEIRRLTEKSRYFAPAVSPDGRSILAVEVSENNVSSLVIIDAESGRQQKTLLSSTSDFYMSPCWSENGDTFVYVRLNQQGKSLMMMNAASGATSLLYGPTFGEISFPVTAGDYVLFNAPFSGIENIYAIHLPELSVYQVTSAEFGACNPDVDLHTRKMVYSDYSACGYRLVEADFNPGSWKPLQEVKDNSVGLYKALLTEENGIVDSTTYTHQTFTSTPYSKVAHLFNFHSWAPVYFNYDDSEMGAGVAVMSQNALSTATTIAGYDWDYAQQTGMTKLSFRYEGWFPVLELDAASGRRGFGIDNDPESETDRYTWDETSVSGGVKVPLTFNRGKHYSGMQFQVHGSWKELRNDSRPDTSRFEGNLTTLDYRFSFYRYLKLAIRDLYPRFGQTAEINFRHSPFGDKSYGTIASGECALYFPGLMKHHGIRLYGGYQWRKESDLIFADLVQVPRGYLSVASEKTTSLAFNYKFPFLYPDLSLGGLAYIKRIKANLFYDQAFYRYNGNDFSRGSVGTELTSDLHLLRFLLPIDTGIRVGYRLDDNRWFADFLFSVTLSI